MSRLPLCRHRSWKIYTCRIACFEVLIILWFAEIAGNLTFVDTLYCIVDVAMAVQQDAKSIGGLESALSQKLRPVHAGRALIRNDNRDFVFFEYF